MPNISLEKKQKLSDEDLMELYKAGDSQAFDILYQRHSGRVYGFLQKKVNSELAKELVQETFLKIHRSRHQYSSQYPFLPWLFAISRNVVLDSLRLNETKLSQRSSAVTTENVAVAKNEFQESGSEELALAVKALPEDQRRAIELRYMSDWSFEKIAIEIDTTVENSRKLVSRGVKKIRSILQGGGK